MAYEDSIKYVEQSVTEFAAHGVYDGLIADASGRFENDDFLLELSSKINSENRSKIIRLTWDEARFLAAFLERVTRS